MAEAITAAAVWVGNAVGTAVGSTLTAAGVSSSVALPIAAVAANVAYGVSAIALYAGTQYAIDAVSRPKIKPPGSELQFNIDPDYPREMIIGQRLVGGSMVARYSRSTNLYNAHMVIQLADHPCVELSKVYDGGRLVRDTPLTHGARTEVTAYSNSGGARVWMTWHDGRPGQTADSDLVTKSAQDPEVVAGKIEGWTSSHVGAGCAYVHVEVQWDSDILTSIPQFQFLVKGAKLYDRRLDTTAGGSGSHRLNDPSTWAYSTNAMVAMDHFLLGYQVEDDPLAFGIGLSATEVPYAQFEAAADLCDEDVETGTGGAVETIKRYAINGVISAGDYFEEVVEAMQLQMAARVVDLGGRIGILGAEERAITVSLTEDDLVAGEPLQFADKLQFTDLVGTVTGTFSDPANNYQPSAYAPLVSAYAALPDGGEAQATTLPFPYEIHPRRVVRLASAWLERESLQPRLAGVFMPKAWKLEPGDWFEFTSARLQVEAAKFEVIDIVKNDDFTVTITARAIDPAFLAFDNDNDPDLSVPPDVAPISMFLDEPEFTVEVTTLEAGGVIEPALEFTLTSDEGVAREIVVEYGKWDGSDIEGPTLVDSIHVSQVVTKLRKGVLPSTAYKVRAKAKAGRRESAWTAWSSVVTTGATYAVGSASSVPWSGVTGSGKPDDNADVTAANTAAAIAGQGALATLSAVAGANLAAGVGRNGLIDTEFRYTSSFWRAVAQSGSVGLAVNTSTNGIRRATLTGAGVTVGHYLQLDTFLQINAFPVAAGQWAEGFAWVGGTNLSSVNVFIDFRDAAGANTGFSSIPSDTTPSAGSGEMSTFEKIGVIAQAPANTVKAYLCVRGVASSSAPVLQVTKAFLGRAQSGQTELSPWNPGFDGEAGANITESRTSAAITGQGAFATLSAINSALADANNLLRRATGGLFSGELNADLTSAHTAAAITGQGALATKATIDSSALMGAGVVVYTALASTAVRLGTNITRADGATALTDALAVTSLGTAAAIASQGALATLSAVGTSQITDNVITYLKLTSTAVRLGTNITRNDGSTSLTDALAVTSLGTAAAITGQGALATKATIDSAALMGANVVAYTALTTTAVRLGTNITRADGSTSLTDALVVTSIGTAAAIVSQGALATANTAAWGSQVSGRPTNVAALAGTELIDNGLVPVAGFNRNPTFQAWASTNPDNYSVVGTPTVTKNTTNHIYGAHCLDVTSAASASQWLVTANDMRLPNADLWVTIEWEIELVSGDFKRAGIWYEKRRPDSSNINDWKVSFETEHGAAPAAGKYTGVKTFQASSLGSPTGDPASSRLYLMMNWSGLAGSADSAKQIRWHRALVRPSTQQEIAAALGLQSTGKLSSIAGVFGDDLKETSGGVVATLVNFKTSSGTAAAIASQGALATLGQVNLGASGRVYRDDGSTRLTDALAVTSLGTAAAIASQGALATLAQVNLGASGRVYRDDGTTRLTDALAVTSLGTAAAITGQGALATKATIDSSALVGSGVIIFSALASTAVRLGTNITRNDGTTSLTDALAVTSLGTAAAITSQGALATLGQVNLGASGLVYRDDGTTRLTDALAVTSLGTAAAITGQGALATKSVAGPADVSRWEGNNEIRDPGFTDTTNFWSLGAGWTVSTNSQITANLYAPQGLVAAGAGKASGATDDALMAAGVAIPVEPNGKYLLSCAARYTSGYTGILILRARWLDQAGTLISEGNVSLGTDYRSVAAGADTTNQISAIATAPANARFLLVRARTTWSTSLTNAGSVYMARPMVQRSLTSEQIAPGAIALGASGTVYRDDATTRLTDALAVTSLGTAAAITSQGGLATLNFATIGTNLRRADGTTVATEAAVVTSLGTASAISGQGGLATLSFVTIATNLRLADGTTVATTAMVVTASGTAAAIAGQGALATLNTAGTSQIASNAVTQGVAGETDAAVDVLSSSWVTLESEAITVADAAALVKIDWSFFVAVSGEPSDDLLVRIKRDSTVIYETTAARVPAPFSFYTEETGQMDFYQTFTGQVAGFDTDTPGSAATYTYTLEAKANLSTIGPWSIARRRLFLMQFKR
jgi:hypothetical protein